MEKLYKKIGWKNRPNLSTPLGATNMNKIDEALDGLDNRTIELDEQRANHKRLIDGLYFNVNENTSAIEDLTKKSNDIDALKIISTASGSSAYIDDASNMNIEDITFYGESKQNGTPTPTSPIPIESKIVNRVVVTENNEPYQSQTVNLSAPIELNGFEDVRDTDKIKKLGVVVFDGSSDENWAGSSYLAGRYGYTLKAKVNGKCICTMAKNATNNLVGYCHINQSGAFYINTSFATVNEWKAHLQANPMTVVYELATPIETELPQVDIDAIKNLHTYKPNTVVTNDADAEMEVSYVADSKLYIDKKFRELATVIVNQ